MTTLRTAAQQALDALYDIDATGVPVGHIDAVIDTLKAALEQPEQEPVAWVNADHLQGLTLGYYGHVEIYTDESQGRIPLYTHPPRREWRSLSEEEVWSQYQTLWPFHPAEEPRLAADISKFVRAIEQALRSKNQ